MGGGWHAIALQVDATTAPLSIIVFVDKAQNQSPTSLVAWAADFTSYDLLKSQSRTFET